MRITTMANVMSAVDDKKTALVRASSTALARRGLHDLEVAEQKTKGGTCCPEDQARLLFCLDHQCSHEQCPNVPHLDFALVPLKDVRPEALQHSIQEGPLVGEYYVIQPDTGWEVVEDGEVGWEPEPRPDRTTWLKVPESLRGRVFGPFFTISEAQQFAEARRRGEHNQVVTLPRVIPHVWCSDGCCSFCGESDPAQHGQSCPKRTCYTWYEVLGVSDRADQSQIENAYRELTKAWDLKRLRYRDDIRYEWGEFGYSETQLKWFNAAHAVLGNPIKRQEYDAELLRRRRSNPESLAKQTDGSTGR